MLKQVDWKDLQTGTPCRFHGDFHFENILYNLKKKKFIFLDWRQDFGGNLEFGDIYYDLAKLLHGIILSHKIVAGNLFSVKWKKNEINYRFKREKLSSLIEISFEKWCIKNSYSFKKVKILTSLIYLNIAPLHHYPYSLFLYALGKSMLNKELNKKK